MAFKPEASRVYYNVLWRGRPRPRSRQQRDQILTVEAGVEACGFSRTKTD